MMWRKPSDDVQQLIGELGQINQELSPKAGQHRDERQLGRAIETATQALEIALGLGEESPAASYAKNCLAKLYVVAGEYAKAAPLYRQALAINRKAFGEESENVAIVLHNMAEMNEAAGDYAAARPLLEEALAIRRRVPRERHRDLVTNLDDLARVYYDMGDYHAARPLLEEALALRRERGEKDPHIATNLAGLATVDLATGDYAAAALLFKEALGIARETQGEESTAVASVLNGLAAVHRAVGNYAAAAPLYLRSLTIRRKALGEEHPDVATTLNNLAVLHQAAGDYAAARPLLEEALAIQRKALGQGHPDLVNTLNNLVAIHQATGDVEAAHAHLNEALEIARQALGKEHPNFAVSLTHLAAQYRAVGDYAAAQRLLEEALAIRRKTLGEKHPHVAETLNNLAVGHAANGDYTAAEPLLQEALAIVRATVGEGHAEIATIVNNLAIGHINRGDYGCAEPLLQEALTIYRAALGEMHPLVATGLLNLAMVYGATGRAAEARHLMDQAAEIAERTLGHVFAVSSERQRMAYLGTLAMELHRYLSLILEDLADTPAAVQAGLELVMRRKALGAEALAVQRDAVLGGHYPAIEGKLRELSTLRGQIGRKTLDGPGPEGSDGHRRILAGWNSRREKLEAELARQIPEMRLEQRLREADRRAIATALPADSVLVEFVRFDVFDFRAVPARDQRSWKPARYLAFVLPAGRPDDVRMVDLGEAERIDRLLAAFLESTSGGKGLLPPKRREAGQKKPRTKRQDPGIASPVATRDFLGRSPLSQASSTSDGAALRAALFDRLAAALGGCRRLLLVPDGELARLPFEVLPTGDGRRLIDDYLISYLSVGRDVLRFMTDVADQPGDPVVAADPDFDFASSGMASPTETVTPRVRRQSRDLDRGSLRFDRLRGTRVEGERIAASLGVPPLLQDEVLEARLKALRSPRILHLATHGFFLPDQPHDPVPKSLPMSDIGATADIGIDRLSAGRLESPFLRSGLALAGANAWLQQRALPPEAEDGLLTAEDVSGLNLLRTELVVLSACQTGLGDIHVGEGVFGLRRAFVQAGAKTLVMSLWKVPDKQTAELMEDFYRSLRAGGPRAEALREAQLTMKAKYPDPFYWGAFICQGDPHQLRAQAVTNRDAVGHEEHPPAQPSKVMVQEPLHQAQTPSAGQNVNLRMKLLQATFSARGDGLHQSPLHQRALELGVGAPLHATGGRISCEGSDYAYQVFARDTLFEDSERPGEAQCLSHLDGGRMPTSGLGLALLEASYRAVGAELRPSDIYHQAATTEQLGYPLSGRAGTRQYDFQVFSADVLFDSLPKTVQKHPDDIKRLSAMAEGSRDYLWADTYRTLNLTFDPASPFHQLATERWIGVPLGAVLTVQHEGITFRVQVFTLDTVYVAPDGVPRRMSDLALDDTSEIVENVTVSSSSADPRGPARVGQSLESFHDDAKMYWGLGSWHAVLKQYEEALTAFDRAIELDPGVSDFYYSRGSVYADLGMNQEALADFNHSIQLDPNRAATYNDRGVIFRELRRYVEALTDFDQAISLDKNYAKAYNNRGLAYGVLGKYEEALKDLTRVIDIDKDVSFVYFSRGLTYGHLERFDEALNDFDRAIELDPNHADAYASRANIYNKLKRYEDALRDCDKAMALNPKGALAYINAAVALRYSGRFSEVIPVLEKAVQIGDPNHSSQAMQMLTQAKALLRR
jgi:tetratricopeptide (TPR) repeat protein/CHAT domain-containing protein